MITEDYVSFEVAKLLKEKGFDGECRAFWKDWKGEIRLCSCNRAHMFDYCHNSMLERYNDAEETNIAAPTLQMAMKWLREVHNIHPNIVVEVYGPYPLYKIDRICDGDEEKWVDFESDENTSCLYNTPEEACEAAIKYCLENLI